MGCHLLLGGVGSLEEKMWLIVLAHSSEIALSFLFRALRALNQISPYDSFVANHSVLCNSTLGPKSILLQHSDTFHPRNELVF